MYPDFLLKRINDFYKNVIEVRKNKKHLVIGKSVQVDSIILTSNDYLAIANHPKILTAQEKEIKNQHNKVIMSAVFMGENTLKGVFEKEMAEYLGYESTVLCQSGWAANVGLLQAIAEKDIPVYIDFFAHMSLWEGIRVANAKPVAFLHNNIAHLEKLLNKNGPGIILIDSLYSTIGDVAPIAQIAELSQQYSAFLLLMN
ncbi:MAG: aminotransferase class I/II-fold pyridoxal phosphate-dependent enzyme, partial [Alphaproteobacteria bacterium]|nr:aminotransferase class I/II-fold pyridoxal phosphate-dependent enzyme [Alphaproteobacteria bacterium]